METFWDAAAEPLAERGLQSAADATRLARDSPGYRDRKQDDACGVNG